MGKRKSRTPSSFTDYAMTQARQTQSPIILDGRSEPEPDAWVVPGSPRDHTRAHPTRPGRTGPTLRSWAYSAIETLGTDSTVAPLAAPAATIRVADLLP